MVAAVSVKRLVEPDEVAGVTLFLCGAASGALDGSAFSMDGGWTAH